MRASTLVFMPLKDSYDKYLNEGSEQEHGEEEQVGEDVERTAGSTRTPVQHRRTYEVMVPVSQNHELENTLTTASSPGNACDILDAEDFLGALQNTPGLNQKREQGTSPHLLAAPVGRNVLDADNQETYTVLLRMCTWQMVV
jgi:hypothetical protein